MFDWLNKEVKEEIVKTQIPQKEADKNDYSGELTEREFNYLLTVLDSDEVKLEPESNSDFYAIIVGNFYFNGFIKDKKSAFVAIDWNILKLNDEQKEIIHSECLIAVKCICEKREIKAHSKARKKLNELMNG